MNYNQLAYGHLWMLRDLPRDWQGTAILRMADLDHDDALSDQEIPRAEWVRFERAVKDFQTKNNMLVDGKLGPQTLEALRNAFQVLPQLNTLKAVGQVVFTRAEQPTAPPAEYRAPKWLDGEWVESNPYTYTEKREAVYSAQGCTITNLIVALWESQVENRPEALAALQIKREAIKAKYPKEQ